MNEHIHFAYCLDGPDRGTCLEEDAAIAGALQRPDPAWLHLQADHPRTAPWIADQLAWLDEPIRESLLAVETRPRASTLGDGLMVILRGLNNNEGEDPEDMVSLRLYIDPARVVSLSRRRLETVDQMAQMVASGTGPSAAGAFLAELVDQMVERIEIHVEAIDDRTDELDETIITGPDPKLRALIADQRREVSLLRRFLAPQRDAIGMLARSEVSWLTEADRAQLIEVQDRIVRVVEVIESIRERLFLIREELTSVMSERLNRNLYVLSLVSAVFLPLGFLTGLMGINVAGLPGVNWPPAFWVFSGFLVVVTLIVSVLLRFMNR